MGGSSSLPSFIYDIHDCHVAEFVKNEQIYKDQLSSIVNNIASMIEIKADHQQGKGTMIVEPKSGITEIQMKGCKKKLDEFFQTFMSFEEIVNEVLLPKNALLNLMSQYNFQCCLSSYTGGKVRFTGVGDDVRKMISKIREFQEPEDPASQDNELFITKELLQKASINHLSQVQANSGSSSSNIQSTTSENQSARQPVQKETSVRMKQSPPPPVKQLVPVSIEHCYIVLAPDFPVARFIKYSSLHTNKLQSCFTNLAKVDVCETKESKKMEYHFRPHMYLNMDKDTFEVSCKSKLDDFLKDYASRRHRFEERNLLKKALEKEPSLLKTQDFLSKRLVFARWHVDAAVLILAGAKDAVETKENEIMDTLKEACPRLLAKSYEFDTFASNPIAMFIKSSYVHTTEFQKFLQCKVSFTSEKKCLHLKSYNRFLQNEIPAFEKNCKSLVYEFLRNFMVWKQTYPETAIEMVMRDQPDVLDKHKNDYTHLEVDKNEVTVVGLKLYVLQLKDHIVAVFENYMRKREHSFQILADDPIIGNFIAKTRKHREKLYEVLDKTRIVFARPQPKKVVVCFQAEFQLFQQNPMSLQEECVSRWTAFLENFSSWGIFLSFEMIRNITSVEPDLFNRQKSDDLWVDVYNGKEIVVVGCRDAVENQRRKIMQAKDRYKEGKSRRSSICSVGSHASVEEFVHSQSKPVPFGIDCVASGSKHVTHDSSQRSRTRRRQRSTQRGGARNIQGSRTYTRTSSASGENLSPTPSKQNTMIYKPKKDYESRFKLVLKSDALFSHLKSQCSEICTFSGNTIPIQIVLQSELGEQRGACVKNVIISIESFLDSLDTAVIDLDSELVSFLKEHQEKWLDLNWDQSDCAEIIWKKDGFEVIGRSIVVQKFKNLLKDHLEETEKKVRYTKHQRRILIHCGVLKELNDIFSCKVELTCSLDEVYVCFRGRTCFINCAVEECESLLEKVVYKALQLSPEKQSFLHYFLFGENSAAKVDIFNNHLLVNAAKGVVQIEPNKIVLITKDVNFFDATCKIIDEMIKLVPITFPKDTDLESDSWEDVVNDISESKKVLLTVQGNVVSLLGLAEEDLKEMQQKLLDFFKNARIVSENVIFKNAQVAGFIIKYYIGNKDNIPSTVTVEETGNGLKIHGPKEDVDKTVQKLQAIPVKRSVLKFRSPGLKRYFSSASWTELQNFIEYDRCIVTKKTDHKQSPEIMNYHQRLQVQSMQVLQKKETIYGNITVNVKQGDITTSDSEVIINGAFYDFDLSRGAISSAILKRAGNKLQEQCRNYPVLQAPSIRVTAGYNLLCKYVIHLLTPSSLDNFAQLIKSALDNAELLGVASVALPTLGAGGLGLDVNGVASCMAEAFELFAADRPKRVKTITVVVFDGCVLPVFQKSIILSKETFNYGRRKALQAKSKVLSLAVDEVMIEVYSDRDVSLQQAKSKIQSHMEKCISSKTIENKILSEMDDHDHIDMHEAAFKNSVSLEFAESGTKAILVGMFENVSKLYECIKDLVAETREATIASKMYNWKWSSKQFTALPLRVSYALEREFDKAKAGKGSVQLYGNGFEFNFSSMSCKFNNVEGKLKRVDASKEGIPSNWDDMMGKQWRKVLLTRGSDEYKHVLKKFNESSPTYRSIRTIERIQHPALYKQYVIKKNDVEKHMSSCKPVERELFHGTSAGDAEKICADGFDRGFAGKNATVYGKGSYFAVNSSYSVNYAERNALTSQYMFLAKVLTGDFCKGSPDLKAAPEKLHSGDSKRLFHSVVDNVGQPNMFVVFKDSSVYPSHLICFD
ncbi:unnamed protein product [Clavelina lepadiformis]|uniref:Poly [ADP-ribose] polymerase n=1 Tax=Clavelina lepadiformis TaxID=159417 RepID=A0ABP0GL84_CLALP